MSSRYDHAYGELISVQSLLLQHTWHESVRMQVLRRDERQKKLQEKELRQSALGLSYSFPGSIA